jgi:Rha family phage regulatory protein
MPKLILNEKIGLCEMDGRAFCDSLQIAEAFERQHLHVLRDTEKALEAISELNQSKFGFINFIPASCKDARSRRQPKYFYAKDGFMHLALGFEGPKAAALKIAHIERFNAMEGFIRDLSAARMEFPALAAAVASLHEDPKFHHFTNELNMICRIALGKDAKALKLEKWIQPSASLRPFLGGREIGEVNDPQKADVGLIEAGLDYSQRKRALEKRHERRAAELAANPQAGRPRMMKANQNSATTGGGLNA